jgi:outer membrane protein assembly complex protein YaeT
MRLCRALVTSLFLLSGSGSIIAGLNLSAYEMWQRYNGWSVNVIEFPGITSFRRAELLAHMAAEKPPWIRRYLPLGKRPLFLADDFASDIIRLERFYAREGFYEAKVEGEVIEQNNAVKLKVHIDEGEPIRLRNFTIRFGSDPGVGTDSARLTPLLSVKLGHRLSERDIEASRDTIVYALRKIGHARARVEAEVKIDTTAREGEVHFTLYPGSFCYFGATEVTGLKRVSREVVRREFRYEEGDGFNPLKLSETRRRIYRLELFSTTLVEADTHVSGAILPVRISLQEGRRYRLRLGAGYDSEELARGQVEWTDRNFIGRGRRLQVSGKISEILRKADIRLFWPHFPYDPTDVVIGPRWQLEIEKGYRLETIGLSNGISAEPLRYVTLRFLHELGYARRTGTPDTVNAPPSRYPRSVETVGLYWDTRDNPLSPRKGHVVGIELAEQGLFWRTEVRWAKGILSGTFAHPVSDQTVLAGKAKAELMRPVRGEKVTPVEDRFYLGGPTSVRGWPRRMLSPRSSTDIRIPIGGDAALEMAAEVRHEIWGPFGLALFCDAGFVWGKPSQIVLGDLLPSAGFGVRVVTPVGPIRTDFGWQLRPNPFGETPWNWHFSIGEAF